VVAYAVAKAEEEAAEQHQAEEDAEDGACAEGELALGAGHDIVVIEKIVHMPVVSDSGWDPG
jgi:hypothetical protein